ncbi:MAG: FkbM family methyltransferase [Thaumarchaeota archaeon]|nr:FkbM family methyltransferase [Nitrososphaerota archaeon]
MGIKNKFDLISNYLSVFSNPMDAWKFRKLWKNKINNSSAPIVLHIRETGGKPMLCRPNTSDHGVLWDTFYHKYHLPPYKLGKNANILDLGANVGYTMAHFAFLYPDARIYGVEMDFDNVFLAQRNISYFNDRCKIIHAAVWSENTEISYEGHDENNFSIFNKIDNTVNKIGGTSPAKTLDKILDDFSLTSIDYLKMDIEGAEKTVLEDPSKWIKNIKSMKIEIHKPANIDDCMKILKRYNFSCTKDNHHPSCIIAIRN